MEARVLVEAVRPFEDLVEKVDRKPGERWEVSPERFEAINSTVYGELVIQVDKLKPKPSRKARTPKNEETL